MGDETTKCHDAGLRMLASVADRVLRSQLLHKDTLDFVDVVGDTPAEDDPVFRREFITLTKFGGGTTIWSDTPPPPQPDPNNNQSATVTEPSLSTFHLCDNQAAGEEIQIVGNRLPANLPAGRYILTIPERTMTTNKPDPFPVDLTIKKNMKKLPWLSYSAPAPPPFRRRNTKRRSVLTGTATGIPSSTPPIPHVMPTAIPNREPQRYPKPEIIKYGYWNSFPPFPKGSKEAKFEIEQTKKFYRDVFLQESRNNPSITKEKCWNAARTWVRNHMETNQVRQSLPLDLSSTYRPPIPPGMYKVETEPISDDETVEVSPPLVARAPVVGPPVGMSGRGKESMPPNQTSEQSSGSSAGTFPLYLPVTPCWPTRNLDPVLSVAGENNKKDVLPSRIQDVDLDIMDYIAKNIKLKFDEIEDSDD